MSHKAFSWVVTSKEILKEQGTDFTAFLHYIPT